MKQILFWILFFSISAPCISQQIKVSGTLVDEETQNPLEAATVFMETVRDSTLITYTITDKNGKFSLEANTSVKKARVNISFVGYESHQKEIDLNTPVQDLGVIPIGFSVANLDEVVIKSRAPITIKKDTLEFNVASFKTKKDATIEDLLKELPGVEVDPDGKIKVNGKDVSNVLVNGKPFFGDDPTIATRNLTKEIIEKVQVVDTKSKSEAFTGEQGDKESKTINLTIKEENNKGVFGRVAAGVGTDKRFEYAGLFNYFNNDRRLSVLAGGNNINSPGFSFGEIQKMFGNAHTMTRSSTGAFSIDGRSFGFGEGIVNSRVAGANYADAIKKHTDISTDYFYSASNSFSDSKNTRENILPDRRYFSENIGSSNGESDSHTVNMGFDIKIDSTFLINIKPYFSYNHLRGSRKNISSSKNEDGSLTNAANSENFSDVNNRVFKNQFDGTKKYGNRGGFIKVEFSNEWTNKTGEEYLYSNTNIFGETPSEEIRNQQIESNSDDTSFLSAVTLRIPFIAKKLFMDLKYDYELKQDIDSKFVFDFDETSQEFSTFNTLLSTDYKFKNTSGTPYASLIWMNENSYLDAGLGYVFQTLEGEDGLRSNLNVNQKFEALQAYLRGNLKFSATARLWANYSLSNEVPQILQLLPYTDVSNPLNTITGNPNLKPSIAHSFYLNFNDYDYQKGTGLYAYISANLSENAVVSKSIIDENNIRETTYANVNGVYAISGNISISRKYKLDSLITLSPRIGVWGNYNHGVNFNNGLEYSSNNISVTPNAHFTLSWQKVFDIRTGYSMRFGRNSFQDNIFPNRNYLTHNLNLATSLFVPKNFEWQNDVKFNYNPDITQGYQKSSWFWNSSLSYTMFKDKGTWSLKVYDLLNQNTNARRISSENFIQDSESTVLRRYVMFGFSYKFNTLGSKGETRGGPRFF
ncbi:TonB-dependent receptor [Aequorivita sp. H23M31]|uniref:TonB-dependent receptor n=1 Tax=Aequorivita ciconiae TaxID=2494375 RepID=A0A410G6B3_9FLAO|nr:outer membrane beta-barrel protein [Aequorivita sp. H23M31]QAA82816.1 TonB-dependent receptor [Aequorivita sp. H23M31]